METEQDKDKEIVNDTSFEEEEDESSDEDTLDASSGQPITDASLLLKYIQRDLNTLSDENKTKRKFALMNLYKLFVLQESPIDKKVMQEMLLEVQKPLLKRFNDPVEKCRELSVLILKKFFTDCDDLTITFPYIFPVLVEKLGAYDLDGTDALPDVMKPPNSQKPKMIVSPPEPSEELRLQIAELVTLMIKATISDCFRAYLDDLVNILCTLAMDPYGEVIREACEAYYILCNNDPDLLFHFTVKMGKSTYLALVHKHAKVRCAGLKALNAIMYCGAWKYTVDIFEDLIGFRDPNVVPIKDFFEPSIKFNYFARLVVDRSTLVRETFYKTLANWLLKLPDKCDHEGRVIPYMISALNDQNDNIQDLAFELLEEVGMDYEEREEAKIRDKKQYALDAQWTNDGEFIDLPLPMPFKHRPRLGSRIVVRSYTRRYLNAIYKELSDWILENRQRAGHLMLSLIIYTEDYTAQYLDHLLLSLYKAILEKDDQDLKRKLELCAKLLGRFSLPKVYTQFVYMALSGSYTFSWSQVGALRTFGCLAEGSIEVIPKGSDLSAIDDLFQRSFDAIEYYLLDALDFELAENLVFTLSHILDALSKKAADIDISSFAKYSHQLFTMVATCFGVFNTHSLFSKDCNETTTKLKQECLDLLEVCSKIFDTSFLSSYLPSIFFNISKSEISTWTMQDQNLRIFNAFITNFEYSNTTYELDESKLEEIQKDKDLLQSRIDQYDFEIKEEKRTRYNNHLREDDQATKPKEDTKLAIADSKENVDSNEPIVEDEEVIDTTKSASEQPSTISKSQTKEHIENQSDDLLALYSYEPSNVYNMATNVILGLLQHPSYEMVRYGLEKIQEMIKLAQTQLNPRSSNIFTLIAACFKVKIKDRNRLAEFQGKVLKLLSDIRRDCTVQINICSVKAFSELINQLRTLFNVYNLELRQESVQLVSYFMDEYLEFLEKNEQQKQEILKQNPFLTGLFEDIFALASVADEELRSLSANILLSIEIYIFNFTVIDHTIPGTSLVKGKQYEDDLADFRKNLSAAFDSEAKTERMSQYCKLEKELIKYIYEDPSFFLQCILKLAIDETNGATKDTFIDVIKKFNEKLPFTVFEEFKRANSLGMLKRVELLKDIVIKS